jgi:hypothetical protein
MVQVFIDEFEEGPRQNLLAAVLAMAGPAKGRDDERKRRRQMFTRRQKQGNVRKFGVVT